MSAGLLRNAVCHACVGVALVAVSFAALPARAKGTPKLDRVEVALWPEFDKPSVLVIVRAWVPADVGLPTSVEFRVPASTGVPHATATRDANGTLFMAPFTREVEGDVATIVIATDRPEVRLEYYMPLESTADRRKLSFEWLGGPEIAELAYEVQQPPTASDLVVTPQSSQQATAADGLVYHRAELGKVAAGESKTIRVEYTKASADLTVAMLRQTTTPPEAPSLGAPPAAAPGVPPGMPPVAAPGVPPGMPAAGAPARAEQAAAKDASTWTIAILAGLLVLIGGAWLVLSRKRSDDEKAG